MLTKSIIIGRAVRIPARILRVMENPDGPHCLEVQFMDAHGRAWTVTDKEHFLTTEEVWPGTTYSRDAEVRGMIVGLHMPNDGRPIVIVDTQSPWGMEAEEGATRFEMLPEALVDADPQDHNVRRPKDGPPASLNYFHLLPVIEVEPYPYQKGDLASPDKSWAEAPEAWSAWWRDSLAESGITGLVPVKEGRWFVPTAAFASNTQETLNAVLGGLWKHHDDDPADIGGVPLVGGLAVMGYDGHLWLQPQCCGDLGNIAEWERAAQELPTSWTSLWIGHPQSYVRHQDDRLVFSECTDHDKPEREVFSLPLSSFCDLQNALRNARRELIRFARQVELALAAFGCQGDLSLTARRLCGVDHRPSSSS